MKKALFRKLRQMSENVLGEEKTNEIINDTIEEFKEKTIDKEIDKLLEETKPRKSRKKKSGK